MSILSSTNSGKFTSITKEYVKNLGFKESDFFNSDGTIAYYHPEYPTFVLKYSTSKDEFFWEDIHAGEKYVVHIDTLSKMDRLIDLWVGNLCISDNPVENALHCEHLYKRLIFD